MDHQIETLLCWEGDGPTEAKKDGGGGTERKILISGMFPIFSKKNENKVGKTDLQMLQTLLLLRV